MTRWSKGCPSACKRNWAVSSRDREAGGREKDISLTDANVVQQFITLDLIDELSIHLVPVLFGNEYSS